MNDVMILASAGVGYVTVGLALLALTVSSLNPKLKQVPAKVRSRRP